MIKELKSMLENKPFPICRILSERRARKERVTSADFWTIFRTSIQEFEFARNMQLSFSKISVYECLTKQKWSKNRILYLSWLKWKPKLLGYWKQYI